MRVELGTMVLIALVCAIALAVVFGRIRTAVPPADLILADGIDDLWTLVRVPVTKLSAALPRIIVDWVERFSSDRFFARVRWVNPRTHSWRFACILGLLVGAGLAVAKSKDGAPSLRIGLLVAGIFISTEFGATLAGYAFLGSYLGLRPSLFKDKR